MVSFRDEPKVLGPVQGVPRADALGRFPCDAQDVSPLRRQPEEEAIAEVGLSLVHEDDSDGVGELDEARSGTYPALSCCRPGY